MITGINKSRTLANHILRKYKLCSYLNKNLIVNSVTQINSGIAISVSVRIKIQKNIMCAKTSYLESCNM